MGEECPVLSLCCIKERSSPPFLSFLLLTVSISRLFLLRVVALTLPLTVVLLWPAVLGPCFPIHGTCTCHNGSKDLTCIVVVWVVFSPSCLLLLSFYDGVPMLYPASPFTMSSFTSGDFRCSVTLMPGVGACPPCTLPPPRMPTPHIGGSGEHSMHNST